MLEVVKKDMPQKVLFKDLSVGEIFTLVNKELYIYMKITQFKENTNVILLQRGNIGMLSPKEVCIVYDGVLTLKRRG